MRREDNKEMEITTENEKRYKIHCTVYRYELLKVFTSTFC